MEISQILSKCDHTLLAQTSTWAEIKAICDDGIKYSTASVCIPASFVKQAKEYIESYLASYPGVSAYLRDIVKYATEHGSVDTLYGRTRYIPEIQSKNGVMRKFGERVAMNSPIQGSAADLVKVAMVNVDRAIKAAAMRSKMVLQIHDELIVEVPEDNAQAAAERLSALMVDTGAWGIDLAVPLVADAGVGQNWGEAH